MRISKYYIGSVCLLSALTLCAAPEQNLEPPQAGKPAAKPNILLILVDDVGYADVGAFAARIQNTSTDKLFYETPRLDRLAREGTMFTQFYACTVCTPTRASLLTGKMSNRFGMWDAYATVSTTLEKTGKPVPPGAHFLDYEPWDVSGLSRSNRAMTVPLSATALHDVKTIPQGLTGYHTAFIGKWHLGSHNHEGYRPQDCGFKEVLAYFDGGGSGYFRPFQANAARTKQWDMPGEPLNPPQDYLSDDIAARVNRFLTERATKHLDEPFFLYVAHPAAHQPIQSRADDLAYFKQKAANGDWGGFKNPVYAGVLKGMDRSIGQMLDKLDELGLSENTAVVFISDNGGHPKETRNTPLRGGKSMLYEGGIRVPMIVRWPGKTQPGTTCDVITDVADIYPTLTEIAGVDYGDFKADRTTDGKSLLPLLNDLSNTQQLYPRESFYWFYGKLGYGGFHNFSSWAALRQGDFKLHYDYQGKIELYNIAEDISETNNLVQTQPERAREMLDQLTGWLKTNCSPVHLPGPNPDFDPNVPSPYGPYVPLEKLRAELQALASTAAAPAAGFTSETLVYKNVGDRELHLYVEKPADWKATDQRPAIVFFFGGGWVSGKPTQFQSQSEYLTTRGMVGVRVEYRVLPKDDKGPPVICCQDAKSAMRWVRSHAAELGIDPHLIAAAGGSAGGHLAAFTSMVGGMDDPVDDLSISPRADALVLFNPVFDNGPDGGYGNTRLGGRYREFSPAHNITSNTPPTIVFLGDSDKLISTNVLERFKAHMTKVGGRCDTHVYEAQPHGFFNQEPYKTATLIEADKFLASLGWLKGEPTLNVPRMETPPSGAAQIKPASRKSTPNE
ncbi:MAG: Arylsulfatase [Verrucomicrobiota bacterium]